MDKKENMIKEILFEMSAELESDNLIKLENVLRIKMNRCRIEEEDTELSTYIDDNEYIIKLFVANKRLENLSEKSINQYVKATTEKHYASVNQTEIRREHMRCA